MTTLTLFTRTLAAGPRPSGTLRELHRSIVVPAPLDDTFAFFADAANLERLTPPWLNFRIETPGPLTMREGLEIDYRIALRGLPLPWRSRIDVWEPARRFVDRQIIGPYRWWQHEHRFEPAAHGTRVIDHVEYRPRLGWASARLVERELARIFDFRHRALGEIFGVRGL